MAHRGRRASLALAMESSTKKHVHHHVLSEREKAIMNKFEALIRCDPASERCRPRLVRHTCLCSAGGFSSRLTYAARVRRLFEREQLLADATDTKRFNLMNWIVFLIGTGTGFTAFALTKVWTSCWTSVDDDMTLIGVDEQVGARTAITPTTTPSRLSSSM